MPRSPGRWRSGAAIGVMQVLRCVHPPGGATALSAVVGGPAVHALGMQYVLTPVLLNAAVIVSVAVAFNGLLGKRRYPAYLARHLAQHIAQGPTLAASPLGGASAGDERGVAPAQLSRSAG